MKTSRTFGDIEQPRSPRQVRARDTVIVGKQGGFPVKAGERRRFHAPPAPPKAPPKPPRKGDLLRPVHPNVGIEMAYRRRLLALVDKMHASVQFWIKATYRADPPVMAMDAAITVREENLEGRSVWFAYVDGQLLRGKDGVARGFRSQSAAEKAALRSLKSDTEPFITATEAGEELPAEELTRAVGTLTERWQTQFNEAAPKLADYFATSVAERSDATLKTILRDGGFSVRFQMSPAMRDIVQATNSANVGLIRSISQQYLTNIEGMVMRSVQTGRDLGTLAKDLEREYGVTKRRAALIARDQNNKATAAMTRARQGELGVTEAIWQHSAGGREPRPTHVANSGKRYNIATGWYDPAVKKFIFPGELINCRCVSRAVIPGFV